MSIVYASNGESAEVVFGLKREITTDEKVTKKADFSCVCAGMDWLCTPNKQGAVIRIPQILGNRRYSDLVDNLETRTGRKNLVIVTY